MTIIENGRGYKSPSLKEFKIILKGAILNVSGSPDAPSTVGFEGIENDEESFNW